MIPCAFLRIFRPLEAFGEPERSEWERYIVSGTAPPTGPPRYRHLAPEPGTPFGFLEAVEGEHAEVRFEAGRYYVCPWRTHLRALASIVSMRESPPEEGEGPLVSEADARRAARELARVRRRDPTLIPSMLQSPWHVPIRWFVMFQERERRIVETTGGDFRLRYWAPIGPATRRAPRSAGSSPGRGRRAGTAFSPCSPATRGRERHRSPRPRTGRVFTPPAGPGASARSRTDGTGSPRRSWPEWPGC